MKKILCLTVLLMASFGVMAQEKADEAMKKLAFLEGKWEGKAMAMQGPGQQMNLDQHEDVSYKLGGKMLFIEGKGYQGDSLAFNAVAVITYNEWKEGYEMKAWRANGQSTDAYLKELGQDHFEWGFDIPQGGKIKYEISLNDQGQWHEVGQYSPNGEKWYPSFEMTLDKK
ncbi:hypothetical protein IFO69_07380 [Echinicola sp. CAU 1574]|uniref:DUF1579 domain-containing protein n=1 Tax=Echinicola arenosa TaxID=2774144 RepID=A0ABR9AJ51_9BACT|nr:hypothetical protein [Echinicola arenosa]MBD8488559.1 hypothetical protein [Echinicola arenosa]